MKEIADTAPQWWEIQNVPTECIRELRRRNNTINIGMSIPQPYIPNSNFNFDANYNKYKGPLTPWVRIFSNSTGKTINGLVPRSVYLNKNKQQKNYDGFILKGGDGFYDAFGYEQNKSLNSRYAIIGYEANGNPHYIDNIDRSQIAYNTIIDPKFPQNNQAPSIVPPPGIVSLNVKQSKDLLTYADFEFKCFGLAQLEYLTPFFLTAGMNLIVEFGWNLFNQKSIVDLSNLDECWKVTNEPQTALDRSALSNGNYGCVTGIITKYSFKTQDGFVYNCNVEMISRQALYAGLRTENNSKAVIKTRSTTQSSDIEFDREFIDLKTFIKLYLPDINDVIQQPRTSAGNPYSTGVANLKANFLNYILDKINRSNNTKKEKDEKAQQEATQNAPITRLNDLQNFNGKYDLFYNGKAEDRVFCGRNFKKAYQAEKNPSKDGPAIQYGKINYGVTSYQQISFADNNLDFDAKDNADDVWLQLDFVFELFNLFMSNLGTKQFYIDIKDVIVNAHPNLISCDRDVLIPNPVSPKINIGVEKSKNPGVGGFLKKEQSIGVLVDPKTGEQTGGNAFIEQIPDIIVGRNTEVEQKIKDSSDSYYNLTEEESYYLACEAARKTFKTKGRYRDDLDKVINYLYYKDKKNEEGSASFPFKREFTKDRITKNGSVSSVTYKKYYYGYLKHLYISKSKIIELCKTENRGTDGYKNLISSVLNVINQATDNFWKFEIVEGTNTNGKSVISVIDKNSINFSMLQEIYTFELGSTNNVVKNINFDVSLTNEQATNVLFSNQNSTLASEDPLSQIENAKSIDELNVTLNNLNNMMPLKFVDRLDKYQLEKLSIQKSGSLATLTPGACAGIESENNDIVNLQLYGSKEKNGVLCMTFKNLGKGTERIANQTSIDAQAAAVAAARAGGTGAGYGTYQTYGESFEDFDTRNNYKYLCLPANMRSRLRQMLDDGDFKNNQAKYSGVADNFQVSITLDGIFSFRNLQCFAINNLPKPYVPGNVIFQVLEVDHKIESGKWETVVNALVRCVGTSRIKYVTI